MLRQAVKYMLARNWERTRPTRLSVHEAVSILLKEKVSTGPWKATQGGKEKQGHQSCSVFFTVPLTLGPPSVGKSGQRSRTQYSSRERGPGHALCNLDYKPLVKIISGDPAGDTKEMFSPESKSILSGSVPTAVKTSGNSPQGTMSEDLLGKFNLIVVIKKSDSCASADRASGSR